MLNLQRLNRLEQRNNWSNNYQQRCLTINNKQFVTDNGFNANNTQIKNVTAGVGQRYY